MTVLAERLLTLDEVAEHCRCSTKTLAKFLRENPQEPPLFAKPGRDYLISPADRDRIYEAMKKCRSGLSDIRPARRTGTYGARSGDKTFSRLQALTTENPPMPSASNERPRSSKIA